VGLVVWQIYDNPLDEFILLFDEGDDGGHEVEAATILLPRFKKIQRHAIAHTNLAMDTIMVAGTRKMTK
jgi:hypothetical protein